MRAPLACRSRIDEGLVETAGGEILGHRVNSACGVVLDIGDYDKLVRHTGFSSERSASAAEEETAEIVRLYRALPGDKKKIALSLMKALRED